MMENKFAQRITEMRKKRGWSQKTAASKLGVSQALLSHYEKGIRECGLDFVLNAADIYSCTTDYLLGLTNDAPENGSLSDVDNITADLKNSPKLVNGRSNALQTLNLLYSITARLGNPKIHNDFNNIVFSNEYILLRALEGLYFKSDIYSSDAVNSIFAAKSVSVQSLADFSRKVREMNIDIDMSEQRLAVEYPMSSVAMNKIIKSIELSIK